MDVKELIEGIFADLIRDAEEDKDPSTVIEYLETKRQEWLDRVQGEALDG